MRLKEITFSNLRLFGETEQTIPFCSDKNITILLGNNGAGKTSLLHGLAVALSQYFDPFPGISIKQFTDGDVHIVSDTRRADYLHVCLSLGILPLQNIDESSELKIDMFRKGFASKSPLSSLSGIKDYALGIKSAIDEGKVVEMPVLAYYGTERGQITAPERRRDFNTVFPRWDAYSGSLEPSANFKRFFTWFERNEDIERREQKRRKDWDYRSPVLESVRRALSMLDEHYINPRVEVSPLRFVMDNVSDPDNVHESRIESMSDGYRIMIAMVADIAARMAEANPSPEESGLEDPLQAHGVVLVDEIDLHLHPTWQRKVLSQLRTIFPNVQFVVSTHSPNVVMGALDFAQVVKLEHGIADTNIRLSDYASYDVSLLLLSDLFGLDNVRSDDFMNIKKRINALLDRRDRLTEDEKTELGDLMYQLGEFKYVQ